MASSCYADAAGGAAALHLQRQHLVTVARNFQRMRRTVQEIGSRQTYLDLEAAGAAYDRVRRDAAAPRAGLLFAGATDPLGSRT